MLWDVEVTFLALNLLTQLSPFLPEAEAKVNLRGAGASFPNEVYQTWIPSYRAYRQAHVQLNMTYEKAGSGSGKARIKANAGDIEYAGSDSLLSAEDREKYKDLVMFPTMAG
ncbi:hypothetical protein BaRGS_00009805 [Batillaria attramentaria]|uniref:Uncharacterized protein n=1 Tax=Batillaria attramentaria TaxID=370345 RepID=A0ABD0LI96_9CAEN